MNNFVKQAYVQGLAARAILRARIMQKRAGGVKDYALAGGVGAGGGALIGALINYARKKNMLHGALAGAGIGGVAGLGVQGIRDLLRKEGPYPYKTSDNTNFIRDLNDREDRTVDLGIKYNDQDLKLELPKKYNPIGDVAPLPEAKPTNKNTYLKDPGFRAADEQKARDNTVSLGNYNGQNLSLEVPPEPVNPLLMSIIQ